MNRFNLMLEKYNFEIMEKDQIAKEIIQELILFSLSKTDFFLQASFCGGTALRIFYDLKRFSEDLDFSLIKPDDSFNIQKYLPQLIRDLNSQGFEASEKYRKKNYETAVQTCIVNVNMRKAYEILFEGVPLNEYIHEKQKIKIKFEVDTNPPAKAESELIKKRLPDFHEVSVYDKSSLFAGKLSAILMRSWGERVKGRDYYDFDYYVKHGFKVNMDFLRENLLQGRVLGINDSFNINILKNMLYEKFSTVNINYAKEDVRNFLYDQNEIINWNNDYFIDLIDRVEEERISKSVDLDISR